MPPNWARASLVAKMLYHSRFWVVEIARPAPARTICASDVSSETLISWVAEIGLEASTLLIAGLGLVQVSMSPCGTSIGLGGMLTANSNPSALTPYYGGTTHGGWQVFVRFRPSKMKH